MAETNGTGVPAEDRALYGAAVAAARAGEYGQASRLLIRAEDTGDCTEVEALDLQARIYAQQGMFADADHCWRKARSLDKGNPAYDLALARLRRAVRAGPPWGVWLTRAALVLALALLVWQAFVYGPRLKAILAEAAAHRNSLASELAQFEIRGRSREAAATERHDELVATLDHLGATTDSLQAMAGAASRSRTELAAGVAVNTSRTGTLTATLADWPRELDQTLVRTLEPMRRELATKAASSEIDSVARAIEAMDRKLDNLTDDGAASGEQATDERLQGGGDGRR